MRPRATGLAHLAEHPAEELTLLQEKRLEIARALATQGIVLLLDEVMAGRYPAEAHEAVALIGGVRAGGARAVSFEHVMPVVRPGVDAAPLHDSPVPVARSRTR